MEELKVVYYLSNINNLI